MAEDRASLHNNLIFWPTKISSLRWLWCLIVVKTVKPQNCNKSFKVEWYVSRPTSLPCSWSWDKSTSSSRTQPKNNLYLFKKLNILYFLKSHSTNKWSSCTMRRRGKQQGAQAGDEGADAVVDAVVVANSSLSSSNSSKGAHHTIVQQGKHEISHQSSNCGSELPLLEQKQNNISDKRIFSTVNNINHIGVIQNHLSPVVEARREIHLTHRLHAMSQGHTLSRLCGSRRDSVDSSAGPAQQTFHSVTAPHRNTMASSQAPAVSPVPVFRKQVNPEDISIAFNE